MDEVILNIRAALISTKGAIELHRLVRDYRMIVGEEIPYRRFGYASLEALLDDIPNIQVIRQRNGEVLIDAVKTANVEHIVNLVEKQKPSKSKISYVSSRFKQSPSKFGNRYNYKNASKPFFNNYSRYNKPNTYRRHSDYNPSIKLTPEKRRSVFERLGPRVVPEDDATSSDWECEQEENFSEKETSVSSRINKYQRESLSDLEASKKSSSSRYASENDTRSDNDESFSTKNYKKPYSPENNVSDLKSKPLRRDTPRSPSPTSDENSSGHTTRMNDILNKLSELKLKESKKQESDLEKSSPVENSSPSRLNDILSKVSEMKKKEENSPSLETNEKISGSFAKQINFSSNKQDLNRSFSKPAFGFNAPGLDRPRMRIASHVTQNTTTTKTLPFPVRSSYSINSFKSTPPTLNSQSINPVTEDETTEKENTTPDIPTPRFPIKHNIFRKCDIPRFQKKNTSSPLETEFKEELTENDKVLIASLRDSIPKYIKRSPEIFGKENMNPFNFKPEAVQEFTDKIESAYTENIISLLKAGIIVQIINPVSIAQIWCRLMNSTSNYYEELKINLNTEYKSSQYYPDNLNIGGYFAANFGSSWYRVKILTITENKVKCSLLDLGLEKEIDKSNIRKLLKKFAFPAQSFSFRLAGLEEVANFKIKASVLENLNNKNYLAKLQEANDTNVLSIELFDLIDKDKCNVNDQLLKQIINDSIVINLEETKSVKGFVTHVEETGDIFIQIESEGQIHFNNEISKLNNEEFRVKAPTINTIYLIKNLKTNNYERCKIIDESPKKDYALFLFIDTGRKAIFKISEISVHSITSKFLNFYPPLAVRIRLDLPKVPNDLEEQIQSLKNQNNLLTIRFIRNEEIDKEIVHICEIFLQTGYGKGLISLTNLLQQSINSASPSDLEIKTLPTPNLPELNTFFDIRVHTVISPTEFYAQFYEYAKKFQEMMTNLQVFQHKKAIKCTPHSMYVLKHSDKVWYRIKLIKVLSPKQALVIFSDFGYKIKVPIANIYTLDPEFCKLPYQAIKVKISGIKSKFSAWSVEDCAFFSRLVLDKAFVCLVTEVVTGGDCFEIGVKMFDTKDDNDVNIGKVLVDRNIAVFIN